jgi:TetR/AcrR family transcriptional regulator, transcriptional repressor for nem operon
VSDRAVTTKEKILAAAEGLMLAKSFHSVGLNEILAAVQVPKGSFYHHFSSKEQFGVEMLRHYVGEATAYRERLLLNREVEPDALRRLWTYLEANIAKVMGNEGKCPCLVIKLAAEVMDFSEDMRAVLAEGVAEWDRILQQVLREAVAQKRLAKSTDVPATAAMIQDLWTGAMQRAAILRQATPLREALDYLRRTLR